jgi:3-oxoacyl-[acyl-carrier protein] reductase
MKPPGTKRVALVTAASRGIGYACAEALAQQGHVVEICSRDSRRIEETSEKLRETTGSEVGGHVCDIRESEQNEKLVKTVLERHGRVDIFVFNSGSPPSGRFEQATPEDWQEGHRLCMEPTVQFLHLLLPKMEAQGWGRIVFINSIFGKEPDPGYAVSSTERAAQLALVKCTARTSTSKGVTINAILPGYVDTPLVREYAAKEAAARNTKTDFVLAEWAEMIPRNHLAMPNEIGSLAAMLASESGGNISGAAIQSDGALLRGY